MRKIEEVIKEYPNELVSGQAYRGAREKLWWKCSIGHKDYLQSYDKHSQGQGCPLCGIDKCSESRRKRVDEIEREFPGELAFGQSYLKNSQKLEWKCLIDSAHKTYFKSYTNRKRGQKCPKCSLVDLGKKFCFTIQDIKNKYPKELVDGQNYISAHAKLWWKCISRLRHENYEASYASRSQNHGCPRCSESQGEKQIHQYLEDIKEVFEREKRFESCKNKRPLPFDFCLPKRKILIEFQGEQHYHPMRFLNSVRTFEHIKKSDEIKSTWARKNGWRLICIAYTIKNIPKYLDKRLGQSKSS